MFVCDLQLFLCDFSPKIAVIARKSEPCTQPMCLGISWLLFSIRLESV
jgi:hypothetical protein